MCKDEINKNHEKISTLHLTKFKKNGKARLTSDETAALFLSDLKSPHNFADSTDNIIKGDHCVASVTHKVAKSHKNGKTKSKRMDEKKISFFTTKQSRKKKTKILVNSKSNNDSNHRGDNGVFIAETGEGLEEMTHLLPLEEGEDDPSVSVDVVKKTAAFLSQLTPAQSRHFWALRKVARGEMNGRTAAKLATFVEDISDTNEEEKEEEKKKEVVEGWPNGKVLKRPCGGALFSSNSDIWDD